MVERAVMKGDVTFKNVTFTYEDQPEPVLNDINFSVAVGERVAIVGRTGSGKTTLLRLLCGLHPPDKGAVMIDNADIRQIRPDDVRRNMGVVMQNPVLFSGSIRENICYGYEGEINDEIIDEACRQANALNFVKDKNLFPEGYDTKVGERGVKLSGGQKQRVAIARALIRKPKVLLLDEATSALDAESEHQVQQALDSVLQNPELSQTVIVIAHRLSTVKDADEIIVLKKGVIAERGTHDDLVALGGQYHALVQRQLMSADQM